MSLSVELFVLFVMVLFESADLLLSAVELELLVLLLSVVVFEIVLLISLLFYNKIPSLLISLAFDSIIMEQKQITITKTKDFIFIF